MSEIFTSGDALGTVLGIRTASWFSDEIISAKVLELVIISGLYLLTGLLAQSLGSKFNFSLRLDMLS